MLSSLLYESCALGTQNAQKSGQNEDKVLIPPKVFLWTLSVVLGFSENLSKAENMRE